MPPLYLMHQGAKIRLINRCMLIESSQDGNILKNVPLGHVSEVVLFGNISLTTPAIHGLLKANIPITFLSSRGKCFGRLTGLQSPHVPLRKNQYRCCDQPLFALAMAKGLVTAKIKHQKVILQRANQRNVKSALDEKIGSLSQVMRHISPRENKNSLRGIEGKAAAIYFEGYRMLLGESWRFNKRQYHPSPDPINAMLSFGYTLITEAATSAISTVGLDPYAGFLHETVYNRPSLGLDLVEEFRPVIDGIILWLVNTGLIQYEDFTVQGENSSKPFCRMNDQARKTFLKAYEERIAKPHFHPITQKSIPLRMCMHEQARQIRRCIENDQPGYQSLGFR